MFRQVSAVQQHVSIGNVKPPTMGVTNADETRPVTSSMLLNEFSECRERFKLIFEMDDGIRGVEDEVGILVNYDAFW